MQTPIFRGYITKKNAKSFDLTFKIWCSKAIQIRTISLGCNFYRFSKGHGLCAFFIIEGYQNLIIIQVNRIDERIHKRLPLVFQAHVQLAEPQQPEPDEFFSHFRLCQLFFCNAGFKLTLGFFQLLQPLLGGAGQNTSLYRVQHILDTRFRITKLLFIKGNVGVFLILQFHHLGNDGLHSGIVLDKLHGPVDHKIFQPLFADGLFLAALVLFGSSTFIIAVDFARPARAAFTKHQCTAAAAEQLGGEQIVVLCLSTGRGFLVFQHLLLYIVEKLYGHDRWNRIGNQDVPVLQLADISAVAQHVLDDIESHWPTALILDALFIEPIPNLPHRLSVIVPLESFSYKGSCEWVDFKAAVCVDGVAERDSTARKFAFQGVFRHAANDLFGQISGVILGITFQNRFQNDTFRAIRNDLGGRHKLDTILFQLGLIPGTVVAVPGKTVQLPDQHDVKQLFVAVFDHLLKLRAVVRLGRDSTVNVVLDDGDAVLFGISRTFPDLTLNGFFTLVVTGIAGINHSGHDKHLTFYIIERWNVHPKAMFRIMYIPYSIRICNTF